MAETLFSELLVSLSTLVKSLEPIPDFVPHILRSSSTTSNRGAQKWARNIEAKAEDLDCDPDHKYVNPNEHRMPVLQLFNVLLSFQVTKTGTS